MVMVPLVDAATGTKLKCVMHSYGSTSGLDYETSPTDIDSHTSDRIIKYTDQDFG